MADQCNGTKPKTSKFKENIRPDSENRQKIVLEPNKNVLKKKDYELLTNKKSKTSIKHQNIMFKDKDGDMLNENKRLINVIFNENKKIDDATENFENSVSPFGKSKQTAGFDKRDCHGKFSMHSHLNQCILPTEMNYRKDALGLNTVLEIMPQLEDGSPKRQFISFQKEKEYISAMERWKKSGLALRKYIASKLGIRQNKHMKKHKLNGDVQNNVLLVNNVQNVENGTNSDFERTVGQCKVSQERKLVKQEYSTGSKSIEELPCTAIKKSLAHSKSLLHYLGIKKSIERHGEQKNTLILSNNLDLFGGVHDDDTGVANPISSLTDGESNSSCNFTKNGCSTSNSEIKKKCKKANPRQSDSSHSLNSSQSKSKSDVKKSEDIKHDIKVLVTVNSTESDESLQAYEQVTKRDCLGFLDNYMDLSGEEFVYDAGVNAGAKEISDGEDGALLRIHPALPFIPFKSSQFPNDYTVKSHENSKDSHSKSITRCKKTGSKQRENCKKFDECPRETFREYEDSSERNVNWNNLYDANNVHSDQFVKPYYLCNTYEADRHDFRDEINKKKFRIFQEVLDTDSDDESDLNEFVNKNREEMLNINDGKRESRSSFSKELEEWKRRLNEFDASGAFLNNDFRSAFEGTTEDPFNGENANVALCSGLLNLVRNVDETFVRPCQDIYDDVGAEENNQVTAEKRSSSLLNFFSMDNITTADLSPSDMFRPSSSSLSESPHSSAAMLAPDSFPEADIELECGCVHCQLLGEHHAYLHDCDSDEVQAGFGMYPGYGFSIGVDNDITHASYFGSFPLYNANESQQHAQGYTDLDWLIIDSTPISVMLEDVIQQMLAVQPELLNEHASAPAAARVIDNLPNIELNASHIEQHPTCPVCLCASEIAEIMSILPCQHIFHPICIRAWLVKSGTCPVCRQSV